MCIQTNPEIRLHQVVASQEELPYPGSLRVLVPWIPQFSDGTQDYYLLGSLKELVWNRETWNSDIRQFTEIWVRDPVDFWIDSCRISKKDPWTVLWFLEHLLENSAESYEDRFRSVLAAGESLYRTKFVDQASQSAVLVQAQSKLIDFFFRVTGQNELTVVADEEALGQLRTILGIDPLIVLGIHLY